MIGGCRGLVLVMSIAFSSVDADETMRKEKSVMRVQCMRRIGSRMLEVNGLNS